MSKKYVFKKFLYSILNDMALFGLFVAAYCLPRCLPYNPVSILLTVVLITAIFSFYVIRILTVVGDVYDEDYNASFVLLKIVFLFFNMFGMLVLLAPPVIAFILIGINTILVSGTQYYRIIQLIRGRYESFDGLVLSAERKMVRHGGSGPRRGYSTINYLVVFEREDGRSINICVDRFTYWRIKGVLHAALVLYQFPGDRVFGEIYLKK